MSTRDMVLAVLVAIIWGANFTVIELGINDVPPLLLVALRYTFTALPAVFFVRRPNIKYRYCIAYGLTCGIGQFGCLFCAMDLGMPAGIASVVQQSQAIFTLLFAAWFLKESLTSSKLTGLIIASAGLWIMGGNVGNIDTLAIPVGAFLLTLLSAAFWGGSNIIVRKLANRAANQGEKLETLNLVIWSSIIPPLPLLALALSLDTPQTVMYALTNMGLKSVLALLFLVYFATFFCLGAWGSLLTRYPASQVAPFSLLVPVTGLISARIVLGEQLALLQWVGGLVIIFGLIISNFEFPRLRNFREENEV